METACFCYTLSYQFIKQSIAVNCNSPAIIGVLSSLKTWVICFKSTICCGAFFRLWLVVDFSTLKECYSHPNPTLFIIIKHSLTEVPYKTPIYFPLWLGILLEGWLLTAVETDSCWLENILPLVFDLLMPCGYALHRGRAVMIKGGQPCWLTQRCLVLFRTAHFSFLCVSLFSLTLNLFFF